VKVFTADVGSALRRLQVTPEDLRLITETALKEEAQSRLTALKTRARKCFRELAQELHPDKTGGDTAKTEEFKRLAGALDELEKLSIQAVAPSVSPQVRVVYVARTSGTTSTTTTTWTSNWGVWPF
jgi:hypothetical protein